MIGEMTAIIKENLELKAKILDLENKLANTDYGKDKVKKKAKTGKQSWLTVSDYLGYATASILVGIRDARGYNMLQELQSLKEVPGGMTINEIDREKAVRIYCRINNLISDASKNVLLDEVLYDILSNDTKIMSGINVIMGADGNMRYYLESNSNNSGIKQIACALRRLDGF